MSTNTKRAIGIGAVLLIVAAIALWLRDDAIEVEVGRVREAPLEAVVSSDGRTRVRERYVVRAPITGRVARLTLKEGATVRAGDVLARMYQAPLDAAGSEQARGRFDGAIALSRDADARVRLTSDALSQRRRDVARTEKLLDAGGMSPRDVEEARLAMRGAEEDHAAAQERARAAQSDVRQARAALFGVTPPPGTAVPVRAPAAGKVLVLHDRSERVVAAGTPLVEIGDPARLEVVVDVLSADATTIRAGDVVRFGAAGTTMDEGEVSLTGSVRLVEPAAFTKVSALGVDEQRVNVIVDLSHVPEVLGDGYRLDARIVTWRADRVRVAPVSALVRHESGWRVFVVSAGRASVREVQIGHVNGADAEIVDGLRAGEAVVLFPSDRIEDGVSVKARAAGSGTR